MLLNASCPGQHPSKLNLRRDPFIITPKNPKNVIARSAGNFCNYLHPNKMHLLYKKQNRTQTTICQTKTFTSSRLTCSKHYQATITLYVLCVQKRKKKDPHTQAFEASWFLGSLQLRIQLLFLCDMKKKSLKIMWVLIEV